MNDIIKPKSDNRNYEYIVLNNDMRIVLIHDPNTLIGAAAMTIGVGFYEDYDKYEGIAHFLEHMLFMGTIKYPQVNHFMSFLNKTGGNTNAYTTGDTTNYHFDVPIEHFEEGLDIFGQFFISPLFDPETVEKEIDAINAEHSKNYNSDAWRLDRIVREMAFENHPYHHFGCGTKKTLTKKDIREKLIEFHESYYSSNIMNLVIYSNEQTSKMKNLVKNIFNQVKNKNIKILKNYNIFKNLPITIKTVPVINKNFLKIYIQIPQSIIEINKISDIYIYQSFQYIYNLLSHEAHGTLFYYLKKLRLSNENHVVYDDSDRYLMSMMFSFDLTEEGFKNIELIVSMVYNYIDLIKSQGITTWQYNEYRKIGKITFDYEPRTSASNYAISISTNMNRYEPKYILIGRNYYPKFNEKIVNVINLCLDTLTSNNSINILLSKNYEKDENMIKEKWFGIKYKLIDNLINNSKLSKNIKFLLPLPNKLIPSTVKLLHHGPNDVLYTYPKLLISETNFKIYFKQDNTYNLPFAVINIILYNNEIYDTPEKYLSFILYQYVLEKKLSKLTSYANYINTYFNITVEDTYVKININSYTSNLKYLLNKLINTFTRIEISEKMVAICKNNIKEDLQNFVYAPLTHIGEEYFNEKINNKYFSNNTLIKTINKVKLNDILKVKEFCKNNCRCECLIQGNYNEEMIEGIPEMLKYFISKEMISLNQVNILPISAGQEEIYIREKFDPNNKNSYINIFFEIGTKRNEYITNWDFKYAKLCLLYEILNEDFFHQLRSIEQNGYIVSCNIKNIGTYNSAIWGLQFIIQSNNKTPNFLKSRIKNFIKKFETKLKNITQDDFNKYVIATTHHLNIPSDNIDEEIKKNIKKILYNLPFDYNKKLIKIINKINKEQILKFYHKYLLNKNTRRIRMLQVIGKK